LSPKIANKQIKINFKPHDYEKIEAYASAEKVSKAEWIRSRLDIQYSDMPQPRNKDNDMKLMLIYEVSKIGNNLNQLAKHVNFKKYIDGMILQKLVEIQKSIEKLL